MNRYLVVWDMLGLEYICNITDIEKQRVFSVLREEKPVDYPNLEAIMMRARFNSQRCYEIYLFDSKIEEEELKEWFDSDPQVIVNAIRGVGKRLYGEGLGKTKPIIV